MSLTGTTPAGFIGLWGCGLSGSGLLQASRVVLIAGLLCLQGCQASSKQSQAAGGAVVEGGEGTVGGRGQSQAEAPDDFSLSISTPPTTNSPGVWFVLTADGVLRAAVGERVIESPVPPFVRQMNRQEVDELWRKVNATGLVEAVDVSVPVSNWKTAIREQAAVYVAAGGERRTALLDVNSPGVNGSLEVLRKLAWME